ncbi:phenol hydroxylase subunit P4 [Limnobacter sp.]|jgi:phenol/toluene 2-monooxygenase (NADH) P4/A4|uniref:phenol hydroxylase subunit P4 n=1 Tax=Limnobacter sp. TaxID=2003368 RepID=UPI00311E37EE
MALVSLHPGYTGQVRDLEENFHGNRLLFVNWEHHLMFCAPMALPLPPAMPFGALVNEVLPSLYGSHPDFAKIDWSKVQWQHGREDFTPDLSKSLDENGLTHKSVLRFTTPGLTGLSGSGA